jgi:hypothetical protein
LFSFALWKGVRESAYVTKKLTLISSSMALLMRRAWSFSTTPGIGVESWRNDMGRRGMGMKGVSKDGVKRRERGINHES